MITRLTLQDFKAFHSLDIRLKPISLLLGPNNSGKSSVIAPIRLLAQTMQAPDPALTLLLDGGLGDFGTYRDVVHGNHRGRPMRIGLEVTDDRMRSRGPGRRVRRQKLALEYKYRTVRRELVLRETVLSSGSDHLITTNLSSDLERQLITRFGSRPIPSAQRSRFSQVLRLNHFLPRVFYYPSRRAPHDSPLFGPFNYEEYDALEDRIDDAGYPIQQALYGVDYISAMRMPPERTYSQTGAARTRIGAAGENWAGMFVLDSARPAKGRKIVPGLTEWLRKAGLAANVRLNWLSDRHYEVQIQHPSSGEWENLADVGQANSQVIPVLIGGLRLPPTSTYLVEEPEIHLHPAAQADLGDYFVDLYRRQVRTLVETHSEYLILRLQQHVAAGNVPPSAIGFFYVHTYGGKKVVKELKLDKKARFIDPLSGGFFPQRLNEAKQLARLRADQ